MPKAVKKDAHPGGGFRTGPQAVKDSPFSVAAQALFKAGFGVLKLPSGQKAPPPVGFTGAVDYMASFPDILAWQEEGPGNIGIRLPEGVIGIDVDAYKEVGKATYQRLTAECGRLPRTWISTSRTDGSGIRLFRVPVGPVWRDPPGGGIEVIRHDHRYMVAPPSVHPTSGIYNWYNPDGKLSTVPPELDDLPELPVRWQAAITHIPLVGSTRAETFDAPAYEALGPAQKARIDRWVDAACKGIAEDLQKAQGWPEGYVDDSGPYPVGWERLCADKAWRLAQLARAEWNGLTPEAAYEVFIDAAPTGGNWGLRELDRKWDSQFHRGEPVECPVTLQEDYSEMLAELAADDAAAQKQEDESGDTRFPSFVGGGSFVFDMPDKLPVIWGTQEYPLWCQGEALILAGVQGTGKSVLAQNLIRARMGLGNEVLRMPVMETEKKVLYLAMDRPSQIRRSMNRMFLDSERELVEERLVVWTGPPPRDLAQYPNELAAMARHVGADCVLVDSLKDAFLGLTDDESAAAWNRARQYALAQGVELLELHHTTKRAGDGNGGAPKDLADVYGSTWITAGVGSVVMLVGKASEAAIKLVHLKSPAEPMFPLWMVHSPRTGIVGVMEKVDPLVVVRGLTTVTAQTAAQGLYGATDRSSVEKARRELDRLTTAGQLVESRGAKGSGRASVWVAVRTPGANHGANHATEDDQALLTGLLEITDLE